MAKRKSTQSVLDEATLRKLVAELQDTYRTQDAGLDDMRAAVEFRNPIPLDPAFTVTDYVVRDATLTDEVLRVGTLLTANRPTLQITFKGDSDANQTLQDKLEAATEAMLLDEAGNKGETYQRVGMAGAQDGAGWSHLCWLPDRWEHRKAVKRKQFDDDDDFPTNPKARSGEAKYLEATEEAKKNDPFPIAWRFIDTKSAYPIWHANGELGEMLVVTQRPVWSTLREYDLENDEEMAPEHVGPPQSDKPSSAQSITHVEHWTKTHVTYFLMGDKAVRKIDGWAHNYGFVPFAWHYGYRLPHWSNVKAGWGAGAVLKPSVDYLSYLKTVHANEAVKSIAPPYKRTVPEGLDVVRNNKNEVVATTKIEPNAIHNLRPGEDILPFQQANGNPQLREQIAMTQEQVQSLRGPQATGNLSDADNGFAIQSVLSENRIKLSPFINGLQQHLTDATKMLYRLIKEKIKEPVWVWRDGEHSGWMSIGPDDLAKQPSISWDISPETPSAQIVEQRAYLEAIQGNIMTAEEAIIKLGRSPAEHRKYQLKEFLRSTPMWQNAAIQEFAGTIGRGDLPLRYAAAAQQAQTGFVQPANPDMSLGSMGSGGSPGDFGAMTMSPGGNGAQPVTTPGSVPGQPSMPTVPTQAATAAIQDLGQ